MGATADYAELRNIGLHSGRYITEADGFASLADLFHRQRCREKVFSNRRSDRKNDSRGLAFLRSRRRRRSDWYGIRQSQDNFILIPLVTYYKEWHTQADWLAIFIQAPNAELIPASEDEARMLMRAHRHLNYNDKENFAILGSDSIMALWKSLTGNLFAVAVALTAVFLVVGGIVIMNIMLASVTERTREIGIRRSLGARKNHILLQFMTESAVLASVGGLIGIILAYGIVALGRAATSIPMQTPMSRRDLVARRFHRRWTFLRNLSGHARREARPDRSAPFRLRTSTQWRSLTAKISSRRWTRSARTSCAARSPFLASCSASASSCLSPL